MIPPVLIAAHHQVYLFDDGACPVYPEDITDADLNNRVKVSPSLLAIYTAGERKVGLQLELVQSRPSIDAEDWSHIVEVPLVVPSGCIVIASPESYLPDAQRFTVPIGSYRVCVASRGFTNLECEEYCLTMWLDSDVSVSVIKSAGRYAA